MEDRVLDTNVVSFTVKRKPLARLYRRHLIGYRPVISFMTLAELLEGADRARWGSEKRQELGRTLNTYLLVHSSRALFEMWASVRAEEQLSNLVFCEVRNQAASCNTPSTKTLP